MAQCPARLRSRLGGCDRHCAQERRATAEISPMLMRRYLRRTDAGTLARGVSRCLRQQRVQRLDLVDQILDAQGLIGGLDPDILETLGGQRAFHGLTREQKQMLHGLQHRPARPHQMAQHVTGVRRADHDRAPRLEQSSASPEEAPGIRDVFDQVKRADDIEGSAVGHGSPIPP